MCKCMTVIKRRKPRTELFISTAMSRSDCDRTDKMTENSTEDIKLHEQVDNQKTTEACCGVDESDQTDNEIELSTGRAICNNNEDQITNSEASKIGVTDYDKNIFPLCYKIPVPYCFWKFWKMCFIPVVSGFIFDIFDTGLDVKVAFCHYRDEHYWWFSFTIAFVFLPILIEFVLICLKMEPPNPTDNEFPRSVVWQWVENNPIFYLFACAYLHFVYPFVCFVKITKFGICSLLCKTPDMLQDTLTIKELTEKYAFPFRGLMALRTFFETIPQLLLQMYAMIHHYGIGGYGEQSRLSADTVFVEWIKISISILALIHFGRNLVQNKKKWETEENWYEEDPFDNPPLLKEHKKQNQTCSIVSSDNVMTILEYLWPYLISMSRIVALFLFCASFDNWKLYLFLMFVFHTVFTLLYIRGYKKYPYSEWIMMIIPVLLYNFILFVPKNFSEPTKKISISEITWTNLIYYAYVFLQSITMAILAYNWTPFRYDLHKVLLILYFVTFVVGILCMILYFILWKRKNSDKLSKLSMNED